MCLAVLALHFLPGIPVLIAANRDEFHARSTLPAAQWPDAPTIYAGRDGQAGGTWMGATTEGATRWSPTFASPAGIWTTHRRAARWSRTFCVAP